MPEARRKVHLLCQRYNALPEDDTAGREAILDALMPDHGKGVYLQGPIQFDFGSHIHMGDGSYANFHFCVLDENQVTIGRNVFIGPYCSIYTPIHPLCWEDRNTFLFNEKTGVETNLEYSAPVTIGSGCVTGAGSVVTRSIPAGSLAFGNPCRVVRPITDADRMSRHPERLADETAQ